MGTAQAKMAAQVGVLVLVAACLDMARAPGVAELTIQPRSVDLLIGDTARLSVSYRFDIADGHSISFSSSNPSIVTVDSWGLVRALRGGRAIVTARYGGLSDAADINVKSVIILPNQLQLHRLDTMMMKAVVVDPAGDTLSVERVLWSSTDTNLATIDSNGLLRAHATGSLTINAVNGLDTGTSRVQILDLVLIGAGDIADCTSGTAEQTARLLDVTDGVVFTAGDNAYPDGSLASYRSCYDATWGRHKTRTHPAAGNHEYETPGASGYFTYFGSAAGDSGKGYYSYDIGEWHVIVLNSMVGIRTGSAQQQWLRADLSASHAKCTLAYWHHPLFSSGMYGSQVMRPAWDVLYEAGADVIISGHDHLYERFAPQSPDGTPDPVNGIRQFIVGTGGARLQPIASVAANSEVRNNRTFGILRLVLKPDSYDWEFLPRANGEFTDSGSDRCH